MIGFVAQEQQSHKARNYGKCQKSDNEDSDRECHC